MATSNPVIPPPMQSQLPAVNLNPHVHMLHTIPSGREQLKKAKLRLESYQKNKTAKWRMRRRLEHVQYTHAKSRIPVDPHNPTRTHRRISLDTEGVVYAMYSRKYGDRVYVGITSFSAYHRYKQHLALLKGTYFKHLRSTRQFYTSQLRRSPLAAYVRVVKQYKTAYKL